MINIATFIVVVRRVVSYYSLNFLGRNSTRKVEKGDHHRVTLYLLLVVLLALLLKSVIKNLQSIYIYKTSRYL